MFGLHSSFIDGASYPTMNSRRQVAPPLAELRFAFPRTKSIVLTFDSRGVDHTVVNPLLLGSYRLFPMADLRGTWVFSHQKRG
jgi:hypothetical protein